MNEVPPPQHGVSLPDGYLPFSRNGPFASSVGPFCFRQLPDGRFRYGFLCREALGNPNGITHGGALYSFADHITGHAVVHATKRNCATVKFKVEYVSPAPLGAWVEGEVSILRVTRTMVFLRLRLFYGERTLMTADGCYRIFAPFDPQRRQRDAGDGNKPRPEPKPADLPEGYRPFPDQGAFAELCGPVFYRRLPDGSFINGFRSRSSHDNTNGMVHGGVLFTFADDIMGRAASGISKRYTTTIAANVEYLSPGPLGAWIEGTVEVSRMDDEIAFLRCRIFCGERTIITADGVYRLLRPYRKPSPSKEVKT